MAYADDLLPQRLKREAEALERADAERIIAARARQRDSAEKRREIQATYADAFGSFGTEVPAPVDDEPPSRYRAGFFNRLVRRLPEGHEWQTGRADDIPLGQAMDNIVLRLPLSVALHDEVAYGAISYGGHLVGGAILLSIERNG